MDCNEDAMGDSLFCICQQNTFMDMFIPEPVTLICWRSRWKDELAVGIDRLRIVAGLVRLAVCDAAFQVKSIPQSNTNGEIKETNFLSPRTQKEGNSIEAEEGQRGFYNIVDGTRSS
jgi:hypothetical protein